MLEDLGSDFWEPEVTWFKYFVWQAYYDRLIIMNETKKGSEKIKVKPKK